MSKDIKPLGNHYTAFYKLHSFERIDLYRVVMERMLAHRIGAAKLALVEADGEAREMLSKIQAAAVIEIAAR